MKFSQLGEIGKSIAAIYVDNTEVRHFKVQDHCIVVSLWGREDLNFQDQDLTQIEGVPDGAMMYWASDVDGAKWSVVVKTEKVMYEDELEN